MTEIDRDTLHEALAGALTALIKRHEVDLVPDDDQTGLEVQADAWTLHFDGWPLATAWIAIDAEPESEARRRDTLLSMFGHGELPALRAADEATNDGIAQALRASGDALSLTLAELLTASE